MSDMSQVLAQALQAVLPMAQTEAANLHDLGQTDSTHYMQARAADQVVSQAQAALALHLSSTEATAD